MIVTIDIDNIDGTTLEYLEAELANLDLNDTEGDYTISRDILGEIVEQLKAVRV